MSNAVLHNTVRFGDVVPAPGFAGHATLFADFPRPDEIVFGKPDDIGQYGVSLKPGIGVLQAGWTLGRITATKLWAPYNNNASDGTEVARGFLRDAVDTGLSTAPFKVLGNLVYRGILRNSKLSGVDAAALVDLNARQDTVLDALIF